MKTTEPTAQPKKVEETAEMTPLAYPIPALVRARTLDIRPEAVVWFAAHLVAVAAMTALGAVVALATITIAVLLAPVTLALFAAALRRHDRLMTARAVV